jgi:hypothetical protein
MAGFTALLNEGTGWAIFGECQTDTDGPKCSYFWLLNYGSSSLTFSVDLPSMGSAFTASVSAGQRQRVSMATVGGASDSYFQLGGNPYNQPTRWTLRLFENDVPTDPSMFTAS